jgi:hypothetical protein
MTVMTNAIVDVLAPPPPGPIFGQVSDLPDPLDHDLPTDDVVVTTRRGLVRVALVAAETGGRFQREGLSHDPMSWMLAPRALFNGSAAIDACLDRDACLRGVLLHGLSIGLDADPERIDELARDDDDGTSDPKFYEDDGRECPPVGLLPFLKPAGERVEGGTRRLYTTVIDVDRVGGRGALALCAVVAPDPEAVRRRLAERHGDWIANGARIVEGVDHRDARVAELASPSLLALLEHVEDDPGCAEGDGFDVTVERRFA